MKNLYTYLLLVILFPIHSFELSGVATGKVTISLRPSYVYLKSDTSQGAVLVTLSDYSTNDVRYRLFNGSNQYTCWNSLTNSYITSASYSSGPPATGSPSTSSEFWIIYQRGTNSSSSASYRDRIGPGYSINNNTISLPAATQIADSFIISGKIIGTGINSISKKYVILAWSGTNLISATSSHLNSGVYSILIPAGITIDKIEVRTLGNLSLAENTGTWSTFALLTDLQLEDNTLQDSKLSSIKLNGTELPGFAPSILTYTILLPAGTTTVPLIEVTCSKPGANAIISPAIDLTGNENERTTSIDVRAQDGTTNSSYKVIFTFNLPGNNAQLLNLFTNSQAIDNFSPDTFEYRVLLLCGTIIAPVITYTASDSTATVIVTNASNLYGTIEERTTTIFVTAEDGITTATYKIVFDIYVPGTNSTLVDFSINGVTIEGFDPGILEYEIILTPGTTVFPSVSFITADDKASSIITNATNINGTPEERTTSVVVTAEDGSVSHCYKVIFTFYVPGIDASLIDLSVDGITLTSFTPEIFDYNIMLPFGTTVIPLVGFTSADSLATAIIINATSVNGNEQERSTIITITAEDGITASIYKVIFSVNNPDTNSSLKYVLVNGLEIEGFSADKFVYTSILPIGTTVIPTVSIITGGINASAVITDAINLNGSETERTTSVQITAEDGYSISIYKIVFSIYVPGGNAFLNNLSINCVTIEGFETDILNYEVLLPFGTIKVPVVTYIKSDVRATAVATLAVNINGNEEERTTIIEVTAEDGVHKLLYKIIFTIDLIQGNSGSSGSGISIYPIPASNLLIISGLENVSRLDILDIKAKVLRKVEITGEEVTIDISELQNGMYFLRTESQTLKFIKE